MIPEFIIVENALWPLLPAGIWNSDIDEVYSRLANNPHRLDLFEGMKRGVEIMFRAGCPQLFLDGSYVTGKPIPNDYEICWDATFVNPDLLDPVFMVFDKGREAQKKKYKGEYFPAFWIEQSSGKPFLDFFQQDKESGEKKGIIRIANYLR
ncbi:hypothetical protein FMM05_06970 [Flavobacterium zepuense]|uniref:Uncharacterized protein n=1 Tax=Flavobacterium zepuense TaxID=2593302 RepID=A0A552V684_9FLAO|nr:hypothetical protein [Flavobacterium zepuense]TRW25957.1 hypothetical protein FMM05_06970 [Flavobacterium zepuense]